MSRLGRYSHNRTEYDVNVDDLFILGAMKDNFASDRIPRMIDLSRSV